MLLGTIISRSRPSRYTVTAFAATLVLFIAVDDEDLVRFIGFAHVQ